MKQEIKKPIIPRVALHQDNTVVYLFAEYKWLYNVPRSKSVGLYLTILWTTYDNFARP